jgi:hypothetical protein
MLYICGAVDNSVAPAAPYQIGSGQAQPVHGDVAVYNENPFRLSLIR